MISRHSIKVSMKKKRKVGGREGDETSIYREGDGSVHDRKLWRIHYGNCGAAGAWCWVGTGLVYHMVTVMASARASL